MQINTYDELDKNFFSKIEFESISSVNDIINAVRKDGDNAVRKYAKKFGDGDLSAFKLTEDEIKEAIKQVDEKTIETIKFAVKNVKEFAKAQLSSLKELEVEVNGNILGHKIIPIESVGCYIPGGNYPLPSSAIMTVVPAKVAGVKRVVAMSPKIQPVTVAAAYYAGADEIYRIGGVQAIAAMAYGTESIQKVNKIVGPGNKFVTSAKKQVYGECGIDFLAGPSEVLIIADETAKPEFVAADILAQCEHDKDARAFLICFSKEFAQKVDEKAKEYLKNLQTREIAEQSYNKSFAVVVRYLDEAVALSNKKAPEHLELCLENAENLINKFNNYGSLFIGNYSAEVFGDYVSGTNHTLPTNQVAKYSGGLSVFDYIKIQTYQIIREKAIKETAMNASYLAEKEGLFAHKLAADVRIEKL
ncbi:TPA: histidinol dehydrogenase [Candidatus Avigastranaerophilus faecigallinarum]|nr:histidinol dehydrogenase [Candidatus Avigastranaerophilus faecigallinarum]